MNSHDAVEVEEVTQPLGAPSWATVVLALEEQVGLVALAVLLRLVTREVDELFGVGVALANSEVVLGREDNGLKGALLEQNDHRTILVVDDGLCVRHLHQLAFVGHDVHLGNKALLGVISSHEDHDLVDAQLVNWGCRIRRALERETRRNPESTPLLIGWTHNVLGKDFGRLRRKRLEYLRNRWVLSL